MHPLIQFRWNQFNPAAEPENPFNPIYGYSLLKRLQEDLRGLSEPAPEDWGWYSTLQYGEHCYMLGASAEQHAPIDWTLQIVKHRNKNPGSRQVQMQMGDPCFEEVRRAISSDAAFSEVSVERGP